MTTHRLGCAFCVFFISQIILSLIQQVAFDYHSSRAIFVSAHEACQTKSQHSQRPYTPATQHYTRLSFHTSDSNSGQHSPVTYKVPMFSPAWIIHESLLCSTKPRICLVSPVGADSNHAASLCTGWGSKNTPSVGVMNHPSFMTTKFRIDI